MERPLTQNIRSGAEPLSLQAGMPTAGLTRSWSWAGGVALAALAGLLVWLGVYPAPFLEIIRMTVASLH